MPKKNAGYTPEERKKNFSLYMFGDSYEEIIKPAFAMYQ
jgi:hypothetical protein